jgi:integral membrane sensor domain MASE1
VDVAPEALRDSIAALRRAPYAGQVGLVAAVYFAAAKLSLLLAIPPGYATAVWPPSGIAVAALLLLGNRVWPGVWVGAALVNLPWTHGSSRPRLSGAEIPWKLWWARR